MKFTDLKRCTGIEFHDRYDRHHICKDDDTPVYYLINGEDLITICQQADEDDGLWRGEWDWLGQDCFGDYDGRETPEEVFQMLCILAQTYVAEEILEEMGELA